MAVAAAGPMGSVGLAIGRIDVVRAAAFSSIGAGAVHAAAIGAHAEHRQAAAAFLVISALQLLAGTALLAAPGRVSLLASAVLNAGLVGGWLMATSVGISFIDGLEAAEAPNIASVTAAALAGISAALATLGLAGLRRSAGVDGGRRPIGIVIGVVVALISGFGMNAAASPGHHGAAPATSAAAGHHEATAGGADAAPAAVVPPKPYDPTKPIDLGGVEGVTPEQQARAENLIAATLSHLPRYADPAQAEAAGFKSINDGVTGYEHYINGAYRADGNVLDPDRPESLVYQRRGGTKQLVAAMYMAEPGTTLDTTPDVGGALTQWHIHDNLCFRGDTGAVAGLTDASGQCAPPLVKPEAVPMIHVWIVPHRCGPFAALDGIAGGSVKPGEAKACDSAHGGH